MWHIRRASWVSHLSTGPPHDSDMTGYFCKIICVTVEDNKAIFNNPYGVAGHKKRFAKNVLPPLEARILVLWERIVAGWKRYIALTSLQKHGINDIKSGIKKYIAIYNISLPYLILPHLICCILSLLAALHQYFLILPVNWAPEAAKYFLQNKDGGPLKLKKNVQQPKPRAVPVDWN
jgi:hypothetical protein